MVVKRPKATSCFSRKLCDVRFGSKADICSANRHVRFTPNSEHVQRTGSCPLWANSGDVAKKWTGNYPLRRTLSSVIGRSRTLVPVAW
jgi:hypothetical protein